MKTLYKYRSVANIRNTNHNDYKYFVDIIKKNRLYAALFTELKSYDENEGSYETSKKMIHEVLKKIKDKKMNIGICSLSKSANNKYLWKKYAADYEGIVIEVGIDTDVPEIQIRTVQYGQLYSLKKEDIIDNENELTKIAMCILTHKKKECEKEEEERVFVINKNGSYNKNDPYIKNVKIKKIILGKKIKKEDEERITKLLKEKNIKYENQS
jgi:hypothetical protein